MLQYLLSTIDLCLYFCYDLDAKLIGYYDASYRMEQDYKLIEGWLFIFGGTPIVW